MKTRPQRLIWLAAFLLAIAVSFPLQIMLLYGHGPTELLAIAAKLSPLNWLVMLLAPLTAFLAYQASAWLIATLPLLVIAILQNNLLVAELGTDYPPYLVGLATVAFFGALIFLVPADVRHLLTNPDERWWRTPPRRTTTLPIHMSFGSQNSRRELDANTFDLSETGAFVSLPSWPTDKYLSTGTRCEIQLADEIECQAEIVRSTTAHGLYPNGIGIRFLGLDAEKRKKIHMLVSSRPQPKQPC